MTLRKDLQKFFDDIIFSSKNPSDEEIRSIAIALVQINEASDEEKCTIAKKIRSLAKKPEKLDQVVKEQVRMLLLSLVAKERSPSPNLQRYCLNAIGKIFDTSQSGRDLLINEKVKLFLLDLISDQNHPLRIEALADMANIALWDAKNERKFSADTQIEETMFAISNSNNEQIQKNAVLVMRAIGSNRIPKVWTNRFAILDSVTANVINGRKILINNRIKDCLLSLADFEDLEVVEKSLAAINFLTDLNRNPENLIENNGNPSNLHLFASDPRTHMIMLDLFERTNGSIKQQFLNVIANVSSPLVKNTERWKAIDQQTKHELLELEKIKTALLLNLLEDQKHLGSQEFSEVALCTLEVVTNITSQDEGCRLFIADKRTKPVFLGLLKQLKPVSDDKVRRLIIATLANINFLSPLDKQEKALLDKETLVTRGGSLDVRFVDGKTPIERSNISKAGHFYQNLGVISKNQETFDQNQDKKQTSEDDLPPIDSDLKDTTILPPPPSLGEVTDVEKVDTTILPPPPPSLGEVTGVEKVDTTILPPPPLSLDEVTDVEKVDNLKVKNGGCCTIS